MRNKNTLVGLLVALAFAGCATDEEVVVDQDDPAGWLGDEELTDEGPSDPADAVSSDEEPTEEALRLAPRFQLPFPCGQVWAGQTRTGHSPRLAIDFNRFNDAGDPVVAAAAGTVMRVANEGNTSYGRWIEIAHGDGNRTRYAHLSTQVVRVGQRVRRGQKIGTVGNTGGSSGAHLHYEQRKDGVTVRARFNGDVALYFGTKNYRSRNCN